MELVTSAILTGPQKAAALKIWNNEYPTKLLLPDMKSFESFLKELIDPQYYLLSDKNELTGWAATFAVTLTTCFFIMISSECQGKGYGTLLLNQLKADNKDLFAWAIDHQDDVKADGKHYRSPIEFYRKNGFTINTGFRLETDLLSAVNISWNRERY